MLAHIERREQAEVLSVDQLFDDRKALGKGLFETDYDVVAIHVEPLACCLVFFVLQAV